MSIVADDLQTPPERDDWDGMRETEKSIGYACSLAGGQGPVFAGSDAEFGAGSRG